jgi:acetoin utilization deacetylase AcuC-like enzyme
LLILTDALYGEHIRGVGHPESPERVEAVAAFLRNNGFLNDRLAARDATDAELARVHSPEYVELVKREIESLESPRYLSTGDVIVDAHSLDAARRAAGGAIVALETAAERNAPVFALVRPPGHHAEPDRGMGFCVFNNVALAVRALQAKRGGRVLVVDFDYHHGNGTEAVAGDGLSYISTHASPAYPGTGYQSVILDGAPVINVPIPASGIETEAFVAIWEHVLPRVADFVKPDAVIVSAGFDYLAGDVVGDLGVGIEAAGALARAIARAAAPHCDRRIAYVLEGGYDINGLCTSIEQIITASDTNDTTSSGAEESAIPPRQRDALTKIDERLGRSN